MKFIRDMNCSCDVNGFLQNIGKMEILAVVAYTLFGFKGDTQNFHPFRKGANHR